MSIERAAGPSDRASAVLVRGLRGSWRWLTSMRTALLLLVLLALAAVPGSLLPQRNVSAEAVSAYLAAHGGLGAFLDRLWLFDVYASPWFSAVYLLLNISLVGCLVPRLRQHLANVLRPPPPAPANLDRLPVSTRVVAQGAPAEVGAAVARSLRQQRWRTKQRSDGPTLTLSAEKGYLKESGNLLFHFALLALLVGVAAGSWYGWHGNRLVVAGTDYGFCNSPSQFDEYALGARTGPHDLPPFCMALEGFHAEYLENGQPVHYAADVSYIEGVPSETAPARPWRLEVNRPLRLSGASVYLLGHGYAPVLRYTDRYGVAQTTVVPFLPDDGMLTSSGVAKFPDANVDPTGKTPRDTSLQVGFAGVYLPTLPSDPSVRRSAYPAERDPALMLGAYQGDLGLGSGFAQSVYELSPGQLETGQLRKVGERMLRAGETWTLPDGTSVQFLGTRPWITVSVRHDPGQPVVLGGALALLAGLMAALPGRRRRVWARISDAGGGRSLVWFGGLARGEHPGFASELDRVVAPLGATAPTQQPLVAAAADKDR